MQNRGLCLLILLTFVMFTGHAQVNGLLLKMDPEKSISTNTAASNNYKILMSVLKATDLESLLGHAGPFTVFAPSDNAFSKLSDAKIKELLSPENKEALFSLITHHIVAGKITASNILKAMCRGEGKASFRTVQGDEIMASMNGLDIVLSDKEGNTATITEADADQCNGVMHEIDSVILGSEL